MSCENQTHLPLEQSWKENCWIQQPPDWRESLLVLIGGLFTLCIPFSLHKEIRLAISPRLFIVLSIPSLACVAASWC